MVEIIVKNKEYRNYPRPSRIFFHKKLDRDKSGNWVNRPAWQQKKQVEDLKESVEMKEKALDLGYVTPENKERLRVGLKQDREKLNQIEESAQLSKEVIESDKEYWTKRYNELGKKISENMPTRDEQNAGVRKINPHRIAEMENKPLVGEKLTFKEMKNEWLTIGRALGEYPNISHLERD